MKILVSLLALSVLAIVASGCKDSSTENYTPPEVDRRPGGNGAAPGAGVGSGGAPGAMGNAGVRKKGG
jgi:hypothetical protein